MGCRRAASIALGAAAALLAIGTVWPMVGIAAVPPRLATPLAFTEALPCPTEAEVGRRALQEKLAGYVDRGTRKAGGSTGRFMAELSISAALTEPVPAVTICDPALAAARIPLGSFSGQLSAPGMMDAVRPGMRALLAAPGSASAGLHHLDRLELPAGAGASSVLDLSVQTVGGTSQVRVGPFAQPPRTLTIGSTGTAPLVRVTLADGSIVEHAVSVVAPPNERLVVRPRGKRLEVSGRSWSRALVLATHEVPKGADPDDVPSLDLGVATGATGRFKARTSTFGENVGTAVVHTFDLAANAGTTWRCRLTWQYPLIQPGKPTRPRTSRIRKARCSKAKASAARATASAASAAAARSAARASATTARSATTTAPARQTSIGRLPFDATPEVASDVTVGDLTGDGRPEVVTTGYANERAFFVSVPGGWRRARLRDQPQPPFEILGDLTGDGVADLWNASDRLIAGNPAWSTGATAPTIDLRPKASLGPADFALVATDDDTILAPAPLPDATGDGRPELLIGVGVYPSEAVRFGARTALPATWVPRLLALFNAMDAGLPDPQVSYGDGRTFTAPGVPPLIVDATRQADRSGLSDVTFTSPTSAGGWGDPATAAFTLPDPTNIVAGDAATGQVVLATKANCLDDLHCELQLRRVGRTGTVLATVTVPVSQETDLEAVGTFVVDGDDPDASPEIALRFTGSTEVLLWRSGDPATSASALPALAVAGKPVISAGPLAGWLRDGKPAGLVVFDRDGDSGKPMRMSVVEPQ